MFSILDMINHSLGYFNTNPKLKNRIYTIVGALGTGYLGYVAIRFLQNGFMLRGLGLLLVTLVLIYFTVMNIFYYFTKKTAPLDISPKIEKLLGGPRPDLIDDQEHDNQMGNQPFIPANGYFDAKKMLPGKLAMSMVEQQNVTEIARRMQQHNLLTVDYSGMTDRQIEDQAKKTKKPVYAIGLGAAIPYFEMAPDFSGKLQVFAGLNQAEKLPVGVIDSVGLLPVEQVQQKYQLFLSNVILVGGPIKVIGRNSLIEQDHDFELSVQLAYKKQNRPDPATRRA